MDICRKLLGIHPETRQTLIQETGDIKQSNPKRVKRVRFVNFYLVSKKFTKVQVNTIKLFLLYAIMHEYPEIPLG